MATKISKSAVAKKVSTRKPRRTWSLYIQRAMKDVNKDISLSGKSMKVVNSFVNDMARVATLQYTKSVGQARMSWLDIKDNHHSLSHEPDGDKGAQAKLLKINTWFAGEIAYLLDRLSSTPEPGGEGSLLDNTLVVWVNELGKGNSHTLDNIPVVMVGGGFGFTMGRSLRLESTAHNRLHLALAHAVGHRIDTFGNKELSQGGPLSLA